MPAASALENGKLAHEPTVTDTWPIGVMNCCSAIAGFLDHRSHPKSEDGPEIRGGDGCGRMIGTFCWWQCSPSQRASMHVIPDNYAAHKHEKVRQWLTRHPRWVFHFTPRSGSWLNAVETFFSALTRRRLKRGVFPSIGDLQTAINRYLDEHNAEPKPFIWTNPASKIIEKLNPVSASMRWSSQYCRGRSYEPRSGAGCLYGTWRYGDDWSGRGFAWPSMDL